MSRLSKDDLVDSLAERAGASKQVVKTIMDSLLPLVKDELLKGNEIILGDLLIFKPKLRKARKVRNPKTGETKMAPEKKVVFIKQRKMLKDLFK